MTHIIPAILPQDFKYLEHNIECVADFVDWVQIDIANGSFAPSDTWPYTKSDEMFPLLVSGERGMPHWEQVSIELDMLVMEPEKYVDDWIAAGVSRLIIHIETTDQLRDIVEKAEEQGIDVVLSLNPSTPTEDLEQLLELYPNVQSVQFMGNDKIGYHGVTLDPQVIDKIRTFHERRPEIVLAIDIGVNRETAPTLVQAGITRLVSGSGVYKSDSIEEEVAYFESL